MQELKSRLQEIFPEPARGLHTEIAQLCKISQPSVSDWFRGETKTMMRRHAEAICATYAPQYNPAWLAEGLGPRLHDVGSRPGLRVAEAAPVYLLPQADTAARCHKVLKKLAMLAEKNVLSDEDWDLIDALATRMQQQKKGARTPS